MIMLIWDDVDVENDIEMRWCWCWEWHWDETMLMLIMTLRWNVDDVQNALWWCILWMYMGDAVTLLDIPGGGNWVVKEFSASLEGDGLKSFNYPW